MHLICIVTLPQHFNQFHCRKLLIDRTLLPLQLHNCDGCQRTFSRPRICNLLRAHRRVLRPNINQRANNIKIVSTSTSQLMSSGDHRSSEHQMILGRASDPPKLCGFLSIARELRDMIYTELLASGNTAILQVSKQVHDEAKDHLYRQGICRLRFECSREYFSILNPPKSPLSRVQNFNLTIDIQDLNWSNDDSAGRIIGGIDPGLETCAQGSGSCHLTFSFHHAKRIYMPDIALGLLRRLGTFKLVTLRVHTNFIYHPLDRRNKHEVAPRHRTLLEMMSTILRFSLGDAEWKSETCPGLRYNRLPRTPVNPFPNAPYLEFHPPRAGTSDLNPGPTVLHV